MSTIDERTKIPLFAALGAVATIVGFSFWITMVYSLAVQAEKINIKQDEKLEMLYEIREDVAVIKKMLEKRR